MTPTHAKRLLQLPVDQEKRNRAIKETQERFPSQFPNRYIASQYLFRLIFSPSKKWLYRPIAKSGSSSLLKLLFQIEFQTIFNVKTTPLDDINPSHEVHMLASSRVFGRALEYGFSLHDVTTGPTFGMRIAFVRDPFARVLSGWRYLCLSHAKKSRWFELERVRLTACCGFDWDKHPDTPYGLQLFLSYLEEEIATVGVDHLNEHWRPQYDCLKPDAFQPTLVGKLENAHEFSAALCEQLGCKAKDAFPHENRTEEDCGGLYELVEIKRLCERLYRRDFEYFNY